MSKLNLEIEDYVAIFQHGKDCFSEDELFMVERECKKFLGKAIYQLKQIEEKATNDYNAYLKAVEITGDKNFIQNYKNIIEQVKMILKLVS